MSKLSIVIVNYNTRNLLENCLKSIYSKKWQTRFDTIVVDNASSDDSVHMVATKFPQVKVIKSPQNLGFSGGNNLALKNIKSDLVLLLNSDTEVLKNSIDKLVEFIENNNFSIGSCKLIFKDGSFQPNAGDLPFGLPLLISFLGLDDVLFFIRDFLPAYHRQSPGYYKKIQSVGWVSGSVMLIKKEVLEKIGLLDDKIFMYGEDTEYCIRAHQKGFKIGWTPNATIIHLGGGSQNNPSYRQWLGEYKGLVYIYNKYKNNLQTTLLRFFIYFTISMRIVAFAIIGKFNISKIYGKILFAI